MTEQNQTLLRVNDAARKLGVSKTFLYKLPRGTPGVYVFGRAVRYDVEELRAWAAAQARAGAQAVMR